MLKRNKILKDHIIVDILRKMHLNKSYRNIKFKSVSSNYFQGGKAVAKMIRNKDKHHGIYILHGIFPWAIPKRIETCIFTEIMKLFARGLIPRLIDGSEGIVVFTLSNSIIKLMGKGKEMRFCLWCQIHNEKWYCYERKS